MQGTVSTEHVNVRVPDQGLAALDEYLARHTQDEITDAMNRVCDEVGGKNDAFLAAVGRRVLTDTEW